MLYDENLSKYSWFGVGGNGNVFKPQNLQKLQDFLKVNTQPITIIGGGSNLLIRDGGIDGIIITIKDIFKDIKIMPQTIEIGCGILNSQFFNFCKENSIGGYEWLGTIPGTIGGAVRGNSGCYGNEIKDFLLEVNAIDFNGNIKKYTNNDCNFSYRKNDLPNDLIFTSILFKNETKMTKNEIETKFKEYVNKRNSTQPIGEKTCGSTFKNLPDMPAWKIIESLGYKGKIINGAKMSEKHCNFLINTGTATTKDLENLILMIQKDAREKMNVELKLEIKIIGKE